jgi:Dam-replacing family protein
MDPQCTLGYKSASQITRKITEAWAGANLFCAACESPSLNATVVNAEAEILSVMHAMRFISLKPLNYGTSDASLMPVMMQ